MPGVRAARRFPFVIPKADQHRDRCPSCGRALAQPIAGRDGKTERLVRERLYGGARRFQAKVRWGDDGHLTRVYPGSDARVQHLHRG